METWGLDLSTSPANTGLVRLTWPAKGPATITEYRNHKRSQIEKLIRDSPDSWWAVDVPFGWPSGFGEWLSEHQKGPSLPPLEEGDAEVELDGQGWKFVARRATDRFVQETIGKQGAGYSVSFDKLGATAAAWSTIEAALASDSGGGCGVPIHRSGVYPASHRTARIVETWPSAAWWEFAKNAGDESRVNPAKLSPSRFRESLTGVVDLGADGLLCLGDGPKSEHFRDAVVCALVARASALGETRAPAPTPSQRDEEAEVLRLAEREGWIHLPEGELTGLVEAE